MEAANLSGNETVSALSVFVQDTDDMGLWVRIEREDGDHLVLIRWDYVLAVDLLSSPQSITGLRP